MRPIVGLFFALLAPAAFSFGESKDMNEVTKPDEPVSFGYKIAWLAVHTDSPEKVARVIGLNNSHPVNWSTGISAAYEDKVFITPQLGSWVLVVSTDLPDSGDAYHRDRLTPWLKSIASRFSEVQYFGTHRVVGYQAWARFVEGALVRKYAFIGDQGLVQWNEGQLTAEEKSLGLVPSNDPEAEDAFFPDEEDVTRLAGAWSIDPTTLGDTHWPDGIGILGSLDK